MIALVTIIAVGVAVAGVIATELLARWALRRQARYYVWQPGRKLELHLDRQSHPQLEPIVRFDVNEIGERGPAVPREMDGTFRVLATGGSAVESFLLNHEASWPGALQRRLSTPEALETLAASRVHVGNIGKSGVGAAALEVILRRVLPGYPKIDLLLVMVGASDALLWLESAATRIASAPSADYFAWHPEGPYGFAPRRTALWERLRRARDRRSSASVERREGVAKWIGNARAMRAKATDIRHEAPDPTAMLDAFDRKFREALQHAREHASRVIVVRQPWFEKAAFTPEERALFWNGGVGKAVHQEVKIFYSDEVLFQLMRSIDERAVRACEDMGVEHVDLMDTLERSVATYYDHFHHTAAGADVIAGQVAKRVLDAGVSPAAASLTVANVTSEIPASALT